MKDRLAYLPLFVRDFTTDPVVLQMRWIDQALYLRMLMASWEAGPLPDDPALIVRLIGASGQDVVPGLDVVPAIQGVLEAAWKRRRGFWISPRLERERERSLELRQKRSVGGQKGNKRRWATDRSPTDKRSLTDRSPIASQAQAQAQSKNQSPERAHAREGVDQPRQAEPRNGRQPVVPWRGALPPELSTSDFAAAWDAWLRYKLERLEAVTQTSGDQAIATCSAAGPVRASKALRRAMTNGWKGFSIEDPGTGDEDDGLPISRHIQAAYTGPVCATCGWQGSGAVSGKCPACKRLWVDGRTLDAASAGPVH